MKDISSADAILILDRWRRIDAQLQVSLFKAGKTSQGSPAVIRTSPTESSISVVMFDTEGQNIEWKFRLTDCKLSCGKPSNSAPFPEFSEGKWVSYLQIEFSDGTTAVFAERLAKQ